MQFFTTFFEGVLLGFGAALPLGPINLLIMNEALRSYKNALFIGLGAMSADVSYLAFILFGASHLLKESLIFEALLIFGGSFLLFIAYKIFRSRNNPIERKYSIQESNLFLLHQRVSLDTSQPLHHALLAKYEQLLPWLEFTFGCPFWNAICHCTLDHFDALDHSLSALTCFTKSLFYHRPLLLYAYRLFWCSDAP